MKWFSKKQTYPLSHLTGIKPIGKIVACVRKGGIEEQRQAVQAIAEMESAKIVIELTSLKLAIKTARRRHATLVICWEGDLETLTVLFEAQAEFIICQNPRAISLNRSLLDAITEYERGLISEQMKEVLAEKKDEGKLLGSARPGHWKGREHIRHAAQVKGSKNAAKAKRKRCKDLYAPIIPIMRELRDTHNLTEIAEELNKRGHLTMAKKPFTKVAVFRALERYKGVAV